MTAWDFKNITHQAANEIAQAKDEQALEAVRIKYLGRKGLIAEIYSSLPKLSPDQKPLVGKGANELKNTLSALLDDKKSQLCLSETSTSTQAIDVSLPGVALNQGHTHILRQTIEEICDIFQKLGFVVVDGPEIETEFNNFTALNIPIDHPSRDAFDTFYLDSKDPSQRERNLLLRSHTSPAQIRIMKENKPPLAVIVPGKVYRPDAVDASHSFMFHQVEGLLVDENVQFSDLKGLLTVFCKRLFGKNIQTRFRPHFFPFTEPSAEVDVSCDIWQGQESQGKKKWLEILGCGMVNPKVFQAVGYPKNKYTGLAFGLGVERIAMLKYGIDDIRLFFENDLRFLKQF